MSLDRTQLEQCQLDLDRAIQNYVSAVQGPGVVLDWSLSVERDDGEGTRQFLSYLSPTMTGWKLVGFAEWTYTRLRRLAASLLG